MDTQSSEQSERDPEYITLWEAAEYFDRSTDHPQVGLEREWTTPQKSSAIRRTGRMVLANIET